MPDINFGEWMIIALVALVVVGPRNLPDLAKKIGGWVREARSLATDFRLGLEQEIAEISEVKEGLVGLGNEIRQPLEGVRDELTDVGKELTDAAPDLEGLNSKPLAWTGPVSEQGPTPEDAAADFERIHGVADAPTDDDDESKPQAAES